MRFQGRRTRFQSVTDPSTMSHTYNELNTYGVEKSICLGATEIILRVIHLVSYKYVRVVIIPRYGTAYIPEHLTHYFPERNNCSTLVYM